MNNVVALDKYQAMQKIKEYSDIVDKYNIRQSVKNSLDKLNEVESRISKIENKNFFQRLWGSITGQNQQELVTSMRDLAKAQQLTIQLVLSLAVLNAENQQALDDILEELKGSKGTYLRITDHIDFLYEQVQIIKKTAKKKQGGLEIKSQNVYPTKKASKFLLLVLISVVMLLLICILLFIFNLL